MWVDLRNFWGFLQAGQFRSTKIDFEELESILKRSEGYSSPILIPGSISTGSNFSSVVVVSLILYPLHPVQTSLVA